MKKKLFVGNLPFSLEEDELRALLESFGEIESISMPLDHATGKKRGFAFVEMATQEGAEAAIRGCDGRTMGKRSIVVNLARPRENKR